MFKNSLPLFLVFLLSVSCKAQMSQNQISDNLSERPKLVVGIVVDQMRYDYLTRFYTKFGDNGFKRMINEDRSWSCLYIHRNYA